MVENIDNLISRQAAIDALDKRFDSIPMEQTMEILQLRKDLRELPSAQPERGNDSTWELFDLITSAYYGKQYYFPQNNGLVYSRASHEYMSVDDAIGEFLKEISNG